MEKHKEALDKLCRVCGCGLRKSKTETLERDYNSFKSSGGSLKNAKRFNNVIRGALLKISLSQVKCTTAFKKTPINAHLALGRCPWASHQLRCLLQTLLSVGRCLPPARPRTCCHPLR
jgi:hypothetical protein